VKRVVEWGAGEGGYPTIPLGWVGDTNSLLPGEVIPAPGIHQPADLKVDVTDTAV